MRGFVGDHVVAEDSGHRRHVQFGLFLRREEGKAGKEDQRGPTLAHASGHLSQRQVRIGIGPKVAGEEFHRARRRSRDRLRVLRRGRRRRGDGYLLVRAPRFKRSARLGKRHFGCTLRKRSLDAGGGIGFDLNLAGAYPTREYCPVKTGDRHGAFRRPMTYLFSGRRRWSSLELPIAFLSRPGSNPVG